MSRQPTADDVTAADCIELHLIVTLACGRCRHFRMLDPAKVKSTLGRTPLAELFVARKFTCRQCRMPSDELRVAWGPGRDLATNTILHVVAS